jgi:hypothetical protein
MKAIWDNMRAIDRLETLPNVDRQRIGVIGHSLGAHNALFTAVFEPRLKVVVSSCGFSSFAKDDLPSWNGPRYMPRIASEFQNDSRQMPFDFPEVLACLAPRPVFISAATRDDDFDVSGVRDCIAAAKAIMPSIAARSRWSPTIPIARMISRRRAAIGLRVRGSVSQVDAANVIWTIAVVNRSSMRNPAPTIRPRRPSGGKRGWRVDAYDVALLARAISGADDLRTSGGDSSWESAPCLSDLILGSLHRCARTGPVLAVAQINVSQSFANAHNRTRIYAGEQGRE